MTIVTTPTALPHSRGSLHSPTGNTCIGPTAWASPGEGRGVPWPPPPPPPLVYIHAHPHWLNLPKAQRPHLFSKADISPAPPPPPPPMVESAESRQHICGCQMAPPCPILAPPLPEKLGAPMNLIVLSTCMALG